MIYQVLFAKILILVDGAKVKHLNVQPAFNECRIMLDVLDENILDMVVDVIVVGAVQVDPGNNGR